MPGARDSMVLEVAAEGAERGVPNLTPPSVHDAVEIAQPARPAHREAFKRLSVAAADMTTSRHLIPLGSLWRR